MAERQCANCAASSVDGKDWQECPSCGRQYCADCSTAARKEADQIHKLRSGDSHTRMKILCPSCQVEMFRL